MGCLEKYWNVFSQWAILFPAYLLRVAGKLNPIPANYGCKAGFTLDSVSSLQGNTYTSYPR